MDYKKYHISSVSFMVSLIDTLTGTCIWTDGHRIKLYIALTSVILYVTLDNGLFQLSINSCDYYVVGCQYNVGAL